MNNLGALGIKLSLNLVILEFRETGFESVHSHYFFQIFFFFSEIFSVGVVAANSVKNYTFKINFSLFGKNPGLVCLSHREYLP